MIENDDFFNEVISVVTESDRPLMFADILFDLNRTLNPKIIEDIRKAVTALLNSGILVKVSVDSEVEPRCMPYDRELLMKPEGKQ